MSSPLTILISDSLQEPTSTPPYSGTCGPEWTGTGTVEPYDGTPGQYAGGQYPGQNWFFFGEVTVTSPILTQPPFPTAVSLFMGWNCQNGGLVTFTQLAFYGLDPIRGVQTPMGFVQGEPDGSLSAYTPGGVLIDNSGRTNNVYFNRGEWYFLQVNMSWNIDPMTGNITIIASAAVQGFEILSGTKLSGNAALDPYQVNQFQINGGAAGAMAIGQLSMAIQVPLALSNPSYYPAQPNNGSPGPPPVANTSPAAQIAEGVIETALQPSTNPAQVHQGVVELAELPSSSHAVIHQGVIEIATLSSGPTPAPGQPIPEYIKRHTVPGNN
jgi:hypothetical protein